MRVHDFFLLFCNKTMKISGFFKTPLQIMGNLCLSQTFCVCHRHFISVTDILYQNVCKFGRHLSMRFDFVRKQRLHCLRLCGPLHARSGDYVSENSREGVKNGNLDKIGAALKFQVSNIFF